MLKSQEGLRKRSKNSKINSEIQKSTLSLENENSSQNLRLNEEMKNLKLSTSKINEETKKQSNWEEDGFGWYPD